MRGKRAKVIRVPVEGVSAMGFWRYDATHYSRGSVQRDSSLSAPVARWLTMAIFILRLRISKRWHHNWSWISDRFFL